jgi:hypothetical protein
MEKAAEETIKRLDVSICLVGITLELHKIMGALASIDAAMNRIKQSELEIIKKVNEVMELNMKGFDVADENEETHDN